MKIRKDIIAIGILFLAATAAYIIGSSIIDSALNGSKGIFKANIFQIKTAIFFEFINSAAAASIGVLLFSIIKRYNETIALAYVVSRTIESVLLMVGSLSVLLLPMLNSHTTHSMGQSILVYKELFFYMAMLSLAIGGTLFCYLLYKKSLIPPILSCLGIVGYIALFLSGLFGIFGAKTVSTLFFIPGAIFEIAFPIWLFMKGLPIDITDNNLTKEN